MSDGFADKVQAIRTAYSDKLKAEEVFLAEWVRLGNEIIRPVLALAQDVSSKRLTPTIATGKEGELIFELMPIPVVGGIKRLTFRPKPSNQNVVVTGDYGNKTEPTRDQFSLASISTDLIENYVEEFLRAALKLDPTQ